jgi:peptidyl-dipeptidase A
MEKEFKEFLDEHLKLTKGLRKDLYLASWNFEITGKEEWKNIRVEKEIEITKIYADKEKYKKLKEFEVSGAVKEPLLSRQLTLLVNSFESEQKDDELISKTIKLTAEINDKYNNYRGHLNDKKVSDNDILQILQESNDNDYRKKAWEASKEIGDQVAAQVVEVVHLRNEAAGRLGYKNHYVMSLKLDEIDYDFLFKTLDKLKELTDEPFRQEKGKLDKSLAKRFGLSVDDLRAWHYADPFFQEAPSHDGVDLDHIFKDKDVVDMNVRFYDGIGLEVRDILERSDLFAKEGKCQHAFCTDIDKEGDVRILCNIVPNEKWVGTTLHELGHAVYDKYLDPELPFYLRSPAHTMSTEAVAMLMGRLTKSERWLIKIADMSEEDYQVLHHSIKAQARLAMLIFVRWGLVMVNFERAMYDDPDQDLNTLWWDCVEKYQFVKRPENRDKPDWAAKLHLALAPVYYQNYVLGELIASQLGYYIHQLPGKHLTNNPETGEFLKEKLFKLGARYEWNENLEKCTGEKLNPEYFIKEFIAD